ncbi:hypothetical protein VCHA53O473_130125 [Vibrio chagasii]|nr:hypothetical protein VCHA53O473_130125 [Vibrio chagasii]CAH7190349.1 hypothetical protein VCHA43P275_20332 [Vibrio chagasii]
MEYPALMLCDSEYFQVTLIALYSPLPIPVDRRIKANFQSRFSKVLGLKYQLKTLLK